MRRQLLALGLIFLTGCSAPAPNTGQKPSKTTTTTLFAQATPLPEAPPPTAPVATAAATPISNEQLLALALDQRMAGEYRPMLATLQQIERQNPNPAQAREVHFRKAEAAYLSADPQAAALLKAFVDGEQQADDWHGRALFLLARTQEDAGDHRGAITTYARYRDLHTALEPYAALRAAAQQGAAGDTEGQVATLEQVAAQPLARAARAEALEALIKLYANNPEQQLARYQDLVTVASKPSYRADVLWRAAEVAAGDQRRAWLEQIVAELPDDSKALDAIAALAAQGRPVAAFTAGRIQFNHGRWDDAIASFDAALGSELAPADRFEARRLRALALRSKGDFDDALAVLGELAQTEPANSATAQAELDYVQTAGQQGNRPWAIEGYRRFVERYPSDPLAPEALWRVVQLQGIDDQAAAMQTALQLGQKYPTSEQAHQALSQAGLYFRLHNDPEQAIAAWRLLGGGASGWDSAEGSFWAGATLLEQGNVAEGQQVLQAAVNAAPQSYYGVRAREVLKQPLKGAAPLGTISTPEERRAVEEWLAGWTKREVPHVDQGWLPDLLAAPTVQRARALGAVDLRSETYDEWFAAQEQWQDDPIHLWQLALLASVEGEPYPALKIAERIVALSPDKHITPNTPAGLLRLMYPTPYARVVREYAQQSSIDPRLLYSLMRQESQFNPDATSWVGALGLAQVMPGTADGIAQGLGLDDFQTSQLYEPAVSIRFGARYFGHQFEAFGGNIQAAAAAYNGGPGNAQRWLDNTADPDLFTELIDYRESRDYVKLVYGNWGMYQFLYQP